MVTILLKTKLKLLIINTKTSFQQNNVENILCYENLNYFCTPVRGYPQLNVKKVLKKFEINLVV